MTRPRPGRRGSSRVPASGRALLISGLLLASLLAASARPTRGDTLPMPEPAEGPVPDFAGPGRAPLLPAPEVTGIAADPLDLAGTRLALLDVAPALEPLPARLQPAPDTPLEAVSLSTPTVSGLPWRSGATTGGFDCLARLRNRSLDALTLFIAPPSFAEMVHNTGTWVRNYGRKAPLLVVSLALLPRNEKGQFARCASGAFDGYFRQVGANLRATGARGVVVRLGWEANIGSDSHPWGVDSAAQVPAYKACFRRAAAALKAGGPGLAIEWTNAKKTSNRALHIADMYPGSDAVDVIGVHYYDSGPEKDTQRLWDQYYKATFNRNPWGLGTWLDFARAHGKRLGIGEWGIWHQDGSMSAADDPIYIDNMYRFFRSNAGSIAYETYFNAMADQHLLCPSTHFPKAAARYRADWGR